jgi:AraC-like DNA-binding protein
VRAVLLEALPSRTFAIDRVARRLGVSTRTLQRRLLDEGTSYNEVVRDVRRELALHYLERTAMPSDEIALLLGFDDPKSFFRAFHAWTGRTPQSARGAASGATWVARGASLAIATTRDASRSPPIDRRVT